MARFVGGAKSTGAGSTTLPLMSLYAVATAGAKLREVGVFNTTAVNLDVKLGRLSAGTGTQGAAITEAGYDPGQPVSLCQVFNTHTVTPTTITDLGYRCVIGAALGAGVIWTFGDTGLIIPSGVNNGIGVLVENSVGQICQVYFVWDE